MRKPRCYLPGPLATGTILPAPTQTAHHLGRVLRLSTGAELQLFDGSGGQYQGWIHEASKRSLFIRVGEYLPTDAESPLICHLLQAISKGDRMDYTLQKAVELGVQKITASFSRRSIPLLKSERLEKKRAHWQGVIVSACEQSGRTRVPSFEIHNELGLALAECDSGLKLMLDPTAEQTLQQLPTPQRGVTLLAGPEGGLSQAERTLAQSRGFTPIRLGPRILRTETAALAALAIIQTLWGDFSAHPTTSATPTRPNC
ncbi:MAG: 16S rRNA (uracil(1498)-N(3))-methyltransferase [Gammaproteobacteria bacterium]|nr:16S rRNA (uracil(1498)-N(3))-methyltransferase [Gammaproteobacteria bacterium]